MADENGIVVKPAIVKQDGIQQKLKSISKSPPSRSGSRPRRRRPHRTSGVNRLQKCFTSKLTSWSGSRRKLLPATRAATTQKRREVKTLPSQSRSQKRQTPLFQSNGGIQNEIQDYCRGFQPLPHFYAGGNRVQSGRDQEHCCHRRKPPTWTRSILSLKDFRRQSRMYRAEPQAGSRTVLTPWRVRVCDLRAPRKLWRLPKATYSTSVPNTAARL